jgi:hypothetical protein
LAFANDDRVQFVQPADNQTVRVPFVLSWTSTISGFNGSYLVVFDRAPMRPGTGLIGLVADGDPCRLQPGCPTTQWLSDNEVYVTKATSLRITYVPDLRTQGKSGLDHHQAEIVLLNANGVRDTESVFIRDFDVYRGTVAS